MGRKFDITCDSTSPLSSGGSLMRRWIPISIVTVILCLLVAVPIAMFVAAAAFAQAERQEAVRAVERAKLAEAEARERAELERRDTEQQLPLEWRLREAEQSLEEYQIEHVRDAHRLARMEEEIAELREQGRNEEAEAASRAAGAIRERLEGAAVRERELRMQKYEALAQLERERTERELAEHEHAEHGEEFHEHAHTDLEHAHPHGPDPRAMDRVRHLHEAAEHLQAAGYGEQAHDLHAEAERLERQLHGGAPPEHLEHLQRQLDELREQNARLTDQVHRIAEVVQRLQQRLEERER
jgi:hypothetical protein